MVQIGIRGTARRLFENSKKFSKITEFDFQNFGPSFFCVCVSCVLQKKFHSIRTKLTEETHFEVCPYRHNASMDWTQHPHPMLCARRKHRVLAASIDALRRACSTADDPICCRQGMT